MMDAPNQVEQNFGDRPTKIHSFVVRIWVEGMNGSVPHYRGRLSKMTEVNIGAFNSLSDLLNILERALQNPDGLINGKDQSDDA
jgi:hypothetical protein